VVFVGSKVYSCMAVQVSEVTLQGEMRFAKTISTRSKYTEQSLCGKSERRPRGATAMEGRVKETE
jgi:hypothetical protein